MKILTLNTWQQYGPWKKRWRLIFDEIKKLNPDIIGFQEIFDSNWIETLGKEWRDYSFYYPKPESGLVLLSRFPVLEKELLTFRHQSNSENKMRYALRMTLDSDEGPLQVINTHLSWRPDEAGIRQGQTQELWAWCQSSFMEDSAVMLGDFNAVPGNLEIKQIARPDCFVDMGAHLPEDESLTWTHKNPYTMDPRNMYDGKSLPERRIDYIFLRNFSEARQRKSFIKTVLSQGNDEDIWPSDHFGLFAEI